MKILLQRTLSEALEGPFWIESAHLDPGPRLHAFLILAQDSSSYFEPRFSPSGEVYWLSDRDDSWKIYHDQQPCSQRITFKFDFDADGSLVSLQSQDADSPYGLVVGDQLSLLDSSLTHLAPIPGAAQWLVSSLETLYHGPIHQLTPLGPTPARRFSPGPEHLYYCQRHELMRQPLGGGKAESVFACQEGRLVYPCWTPRGILVSQEDSSQNHLWLVDAQNKEAVSVWSGPDERVYACDFIERTLC